MPLLRAMAGQYVFKDFMSDKMHIAQPMFDKIKHLAPEIANLRSSAHCLEVADKLYKAMNEKEELLPPPPPGAPGEEEDPTPPPPAPAPGDDDDEEQEQEDPTPGEEEEPTPGDPTPGEEDEEEKAPKAAGSAGDDPAGEEDELSVADEKEKEEGVTHRHDPSAPKSGGEADPTAENDLAWTEIDKELMRDYDDSLSTAISDSAAEAAKTTDYLIYTKELDVIEPLHVGTKYTDDMFKRMADTVEPLVGPLQKDLERAISARSLQQWHPGHKSGRLNAGALSRLATGDARVFRRKTEVTSKDVAVELVVDMSGSMSGSKIVTATQTAYALAAVLERIGIPCEVICFTTGRASFTSVADYQNEVRKLGRAFSRNESIYMPILKSFDERLTGDVKKRFGWLPNAGDLRSNIDGESVEIAGRRLMARREKGKIMMVLSDGAPAGSGDWNELYNHLKSTVKALTKAGLNIVGIGIESDDVRQFYPKAIVLNSVTELPKAVLKELRELILK
jgi:cobalamin biosynthesis protein CobT